MLGTEPKRMEENDMFEANLGYTVRPHLKNKSAELFFQYSKLLT